VIFLPQAHFSGFLLRLFSVSIDAILFSLTHSCSISTCELLGAPTVLPAAGNPNFPVMHKAIEAEFLCIPVRFLDPSRALSDHASAFAPFRLGFGLFPFFFFSGGVYRVSFIHFPDNCCQCRFLSINCCTVYGIKGYFFIVELFNS
jgi:hypothetical protein